MQRREFLKIGGAACAALSLGRSVARGENQPTVVSTWDFGPRAHEVAQLTLGQGGSVVDAAQQGVRVVEADPKVTSVGYGGFPNADGVVELDAAVMDGNRREAGSVAGLHDIMHPVDVARKVMDETPHVLLVGEGARRFALDNGFKKQELLTPAARKTWKAWKRGENPLGRENHDTVGMIVQGRDGSMAAACTTSGLAFKLPGRVGDSPLVGHGLYCDSEAGGATATGTGEEMIKVCGSYQVVEFMRQGVEPDEAVRRVLRRMIERSASNRTELLAFVALRADGAVGFGSTVPNFQVTLSRGEEIEVLDVTPLADGS